MEFSSRRIDESHDDETLRTFEPGTRVVDRRPHDPAGERRALVTGLLSKPAWIAPKYFYDAAGSALFARICRLPEYYPTRTEAAIFERYRDEIAATIGPGKQLIDLGAGDCSKAVRWLPWLVPPRYIAVDIAGDVLAPSLARIADAHPGMEVLGVLADFTRALDLRQDVAEGSATYFYPGSSIGNFAPPEALGFLAGIRRHCAVDGGCGLLIGVDTRKEPERLRAAYDDPAGVTAAFNRNVLLHVNRMLGTAFVPVAFAHVASYDEDAGRVEMHLEARAAQTVVLDGIARTYLAGERIHTENSYKYAPTAFAAMLERAGFSTVRIWQDDAADFAVYYAT